MASRARGAMVIDMFPLQIAEVQERFPAVYAHLVSTVKPEREANRDEDIRSNWWLFGRVRPELRDLIADLLR